MEAMSEREPGAKPAAAQPAPLATRRLGGAMAIVVAVTAGSLAFRLLGMGKLEHTSLVFIGIPALLSVVVLAAAKPRTATGMVMKTLTLALLLSGIILGEAFVCVLFAAPLFYLVGLVMGKATDRARRQGPGGQARTYGLLLLVLAPMSMEGVVPGAEFEREESVTAVRVVRATPDEVRAALARTPSFDRELPAFFQLGFPHPSAARGEGLAVGDRRSVTFEHGHHPGTLVMEVARTAPGGVDFAAVSDDSYIVHWLSWRGAEVRWRAVAPGETEVRWTLRYRRRLDPAWYFGPLERHAARLAAGYLAETLAAPRPG